MNEEMMTTGSTPGAAGFSGKANAKGPVAGFDPVMKFRDKVQKRKKKCMPGKNVTILQDEVCNSEESRVDLISVR